MGASQSATQTLDQVTDIFVRSVSTTAAESVQTVSGQNVIDITNCSNVTLRDITQTTQAAVSGEAVQNAIQSASQKVDMEAVVKQQLELITQNVSFSSSEMNQATRLLTGINQSLQVAISQKCQQNFSNVNAIRCQGSDQILMERVTQSNIVDALMSCAQTATQNTDQMLKLKTMIDVKGKSEQKNALASLAMLLLAAAALLIVIAMLPGIMASGVAGAIGKAAGPGVKGALVILLSIVLSVLAEVYMFWECNETTRPFGFVPVWVNSKQRATLLVSIGSAVQGILILALIVTVVKF